jgi:hypothetical protein
MDFQTEKEWESRQWEWNMKEEWELEDLVVEKRDEKVRKEEEEVRGGVGNLKDLGKVGNQ